MKTTTKKIRLNRETLRNLDPQDLARAAGGNIPSEAGSSCFGSCPIEKPRLTYEICA